jgi:F-type H+-transporting ATPase subunit O
MMIKKRRKATHRRGVHVTLKTRHFHCSPFLRTINMIRARVFEWGKVRSFATVSSVSLPMKLFGLEGRYAMALYSAAAKKNVLDKVEAELKGVRHYLSKNPKIRELMEQPILTRKQNTDMVISLLDKSKYHEITINFFILLAENSRLKYTNKILESFQLLMRTHRGEVQAVVTSAKEVTPEMVAQLHHALQKKFLQTGQTLHISTQVDPSILGGLIVEVGDRTLDLSVATKMKRLNQLLAESLS